MTFLQNDIQSNFLSAFLYHFKRCEKQLFLFLLILLFSLCFTVREVFAAEGMWLPTLIEQQILPDMQSQGCKLTANQIYKANQACLTSSVIQIGNGCSGSFLSKNGLVLTNYHCVQYQISKACNGGENYLQNGFFAKDSSEEIPTSHLTANLMVAMYDVTDIVLAMKKQGLQLKQITDSITKDSTKDYRFSIEGLYSGNQYFLFKTKTYKDIRLVAFMPAEISQFGGGEDNWMWPRNDADFALVRVYENNKPVQPLKYLNINANGVKEGDFTMVLGFPAETKMYGTSEELKMISKLNNIQITMREIRLHPIAEYMSQSDKKYEECYALYSYLSNYYKKWLGENYGIKQIIDKRIIRDSLFVSWLVQNKKEWKESGDELAEFDINQYNAVCKDYYTTYAKLVMYLEGLWRMRTLLSPSIAVSSPNLDYIRSDKFLDIMEKYNPEIEQSVLTLMAFTATKLEEDTTKRIPMFQRMISEISKGNRELSNKLQTQFEDSVFSKSVFTDFERASKFQKMINSKKKYKDDQKVRDYLHKNDALYRLAEDIFTVLNTDLFPAYYKEKAQYDSVYCWLNKALLAYNKDKPMYPDANYTMRISYGQVRGYNIAKANKQDTTTYLWNTTDLDFIEKINKDSKHFKANDIFINMLKDKNFGSYSQNVMTMNFIATNQTSGGNSGSPVLDANGNLIGINFDRNWEGTVSDYYYDENFCRNISVDIRYILFCLEQYGKAENILKELSFAE